MDQTSAQEIRDAGPVLDAASLLHHGKELSYQGP
jgi:hypothetical protein